MFWTANNWFCWPEQGGATSYQVAVLMRPDFLETNCVSVTVGTASCLAPLPDPPTQGLQYYLVRAYTPFHRELGDRQPWEREDTRVRPTMNGHSRSCFAPLGKRR